MTINNTNHETIESAEQIDLEGKKIASLLDVNANALSMRTLKQLEDGRARAVKAHSQQVSGVDINKDGTSSGILAWAQHHRIASTGLILGTIIAGFVLIQAFNHHEASDAFILGADLPPEAFVDRGFEPSLNNGKLELEL